MTIAGQGNSGRAILAGPLELECPEARGTRIVAPTGGGWGMAQRAGRADGRKLVAPRPDEKEGFSRAWGLSRAYSRRLSLVDKATINLYANRADAA